MTATTTAPPEFTEARHLANQYRGQPENPEAGLLASHLTRALTRIGELLESITDMDVEIQQYRDAVHRVSLLAAGGPVVLTSDVRAALGGR